MTDTAAATPSLKNYFNRWFAVEAVAVLTGAAYTVLITYGSIWCWPFALISSSIFVYLCVSKKLLAETVLQLFYVGFGIYGWATWGSEGEFSVSTLGAATNGWLIAAGFGVVAIAGTLLRKYSGAKLPYVDSFTTTFSLIATWMMVHSVFENWIYWVVIDSVSVVMYATRGLYLTALLFVVYTILSINGWIEWLELL